jgi:ATP-dependent protease ClpP protease subunit|tara:strand:+ start:2817 stop:3440 length:624 start_codon:yes stop_codon:yes gene_type:complete
MLKWFLLIPFIQTLDIPRRNIVTNLPLSSLTFKQKNLRDNVLITPQNRSMYFYGDVTEESCFWLTHTIEEFASSPEPIHLHIQSPGGSLIPTFNVIDTINRIPAPVYTYIDGFAASAATLISVVGKQRYMGKYSLILLHELKGTSEGTYSNMKDEILNLDTYMGFLKEIYLENSNIKPDLLEDILSHDNRWMNSSIALEYGLVDKII